MLPPESRKMFLTGIAFAKKNPRWKRRKPEARGKGQSGPPEAKTSPVRRTRLLKPLPPGLEDGLQTAHCEGNAGYQEPFPLAVSCADLRSLSELHYDPIQIAANKDSNLESTPPTIGYYDGIIQTPRRQISLRAVCGSRSDEHCAHFVRAGSEQFLYDRRGFAVQLVKQQSRL